MSPARESPEPRISVVVPMRNAAACIPDLCAALDAQTLEHDDFEVLLVDDGSVDGTAALVG